MTRLIAIAALLIAAIAMPLTEGRAAPDLALAVIVHPAVPERHLTRTQLEAVMTRRNRNWRDGSPIIVFNQPASTPHRVAFDHSVLGLDPDQIARFWIDQRIRSGIDSPRQVTEGLMVRIVARLPGAIGYCALDQPLGDVHVVGWIKGGRYVEAQ